MRRLKYIASVFLSNVDKHTVEGENPVQLCNYTDVYYNATITDAIEFMQATASKEQVGRFLLHTGDVLITKDSETANDIAVPAVVTCEIERLLCGYHLALLRPRQSVIGKYLRYILASPPFRDHFRMSANGVTRVGLSNDDITTALALCPPPAEQADIVAYLDRKTTDIERFITKKRQLIALLNEQKAATIDRAVTKGLNLDVPMKTSGVEWLRTVPAHWHIVPNKHLFRIKNDTVGSNHGKFVLLSLSLNGVIPRDLDNPQGKFPAEFDSYQIVESGDLVFCLFDMDETPRTVGYASQRGMITGAYTVVCPIEEDVAEYLYYFYLAMDQSKRLKPLYTGLRKVIQKGTFLNAKVPFPPAEERQAIVAHIQRECAIVDQAIPRVQRELELIIEYRTTLISDAVTGKIDVRGAAADTEGALLKETWND